MKNSILQKLAAKLSETETETEDALIEVPAEHFDIINAALPHGSTHYNNHYSSAS